MYYAFFLGASLLLLSVFFCFVFCNKWLDPTNFFWRRHTLFFIAKNTLVFTLIVQRVFSFSRTAFSFLFCLDFCSDLVIYLHQGAFRSLVNVGFLSQRVVSKRLNGVGKEKKSFMPIVVQMGACLDCGLDFCMSCLMLF
jgi:hypothetical protein